MLILFFHGIHYQKGQLVYVTLYSFVLNIITEKDFCFVHSISHLNFEFQVLSSRTKIYIILEFVAGGELFDKIVRLLYLYGYAS